MPTRALIAMLCCLWLTAAPAQPAADPPPESAEAASREELESLIQTLDDPQARERLVAQLRLLLDAGGEAPEAATPLGEALEAASERLSVVTDGLLLIVEAVVQIPSVAVWAEAQAAAAASREVWREAVTALAAALGLGYLALLVIRRLLSAPRRRIEAQAPAGTAVKAALLMAWFALALVPIAGFAGAAYLALSLVGPGEVGRLVALAWVHAAIVARAAVAVSRLLTAPDLPGIRLFALSGEAASRADRWLRLIADTAVYGYFALETALLLGLPWVVYEGLMRLLGLAVALLLVGGIVRIRRPVRELLEGRERPASLWNMVRRRLARVWHLIAALYVLLMLGVWMLEVRGGFAFLLQATLATLGLLILVPLVLRPIERAIEGLTALDEETARRLPELESRARRYRPVLRRVARWLVFLVAAAAVLQAWGLGTWDWLGTAAGGAALATLATVAAILVVSILIWEVATAWIAGYLAEEDRFGKKRTRAARTKTLLVLARNVLLVFLVVVAGLLVLSELGVNITPLLAGAGVLGIAIGFGSQKLVQDIITGAFIIFEDLISVGEVVDVGGKAGLVEAVSLRNLRLRDLSGTVHTIPFSAIGTISNLTKDFSYYVMDVGIAYREDTDQVADVLRAIGQEMQDDEHYGALMLEPLEVLGVDAFRDSAVVIKARLKTLPIRQWEVGREFNRRMKRRFDELGIEVPFPHRTLYFGADKDGSAPAAMVRLDAGAEALARLAAGGRDGAA